MTLIQLKDLIIENFDGFAFQIGDNSKEVYSIIKISLTNNVPFYRFKPTESVPKNLIPVGSVEWIESILGYHPIPDYYPDFLNKFLHRTILVRYSWPEEQNIFVKPADRYKRFDGCISHISDNKYDGPLICSKLLNITNEWRYYISNGKILAKEWYDGINLDVDDEPSPPNVEIIFPDWFCGAVDFGLTSDNKFVLIESQHPYACGWYGKDDYIFAKWISAGWVHMNS